MPVRLTDEERAIAAGSDAAAMSMRILAEMGAMLGANRLIPVTSSHIDGGLYHGDSGVHFPSAATRNCATDEPHAT